MKMFLLAAVIAVGTLACSDDSTSLSWTNISGSQANEIRWLSTNDVYWNDPTPNNTTTASKDIPDDSRYGQGFASLEGGSEGPIDFTGNGDIAIKLSTGSNNYDIKDVAKK